VSDGEQLVRTLLEQLDACRVRLAAAEARVKELESRGILNMDEVVNQFYEGE